MYIGAAGGVKVNLIEFFAGRLVSVSALKYLKAVARLTVVKLL
jgi:hypothetical protein